MQSSQYIPLIISYAADQHVQERIRAAEREALVRSAKQQRPSFISVLRLAVGRFMVSSGRRIARQPQARPERWIDVRSAVRTAD